MENHGVAVFGAGGHAKVVIRALEVSGVASIAVFDDDPSLQGQAILGHVVLGSLDRARDMGYNHAVIAIGDNATRKRVEGRFPDLEWVTVVHPRAWVDPSAALGAGTVVLAGAIVQAEATLGRHCILNTGSSVDHDCCLADFVHVAPGAHLAGWVSVGEGCLLGVGAATIPGVRIGAWATIGAGAAVVDDIDAAMVAVGVPARPRRGSGA